jgi:hypothetical protein
VINILLENMMEHSFRKYINLVEGFNPNKHEMNPDQVRQLAEGALTVAVKYIQDHLGVETGDYAGVFFTGQAEDAINDILVYKCVECSSMYRITYKELEKKVRRTLTRKFIALCMTC